ncbi:MAG TPA: sigma 54-interacting transcriptional regulator [Bacillota bacterium]|jgi:transcriptional regulator with PAS, ATPase and Fis domain|nr:sigma 54-interacting transcriptional regulator [Bacillota bacterium]
MSGLQEIRNTVQAVAEAVAAALHIDTEIVDETLTIVAGTGRYMEKIGAKEEDGDLKSGYLYSEVLRTGRAYIIEDVKNHPNYAPKENELAEVCCPIMYDGRAIGLMGLVAFTEEQRSRLLGSKENLLLFLTRMADLLSAKVRENKVTGQMKAVLDSIHEGILSVDKDGIIVSANPMAVKLLKKTRESLVGSSIFSIWPNSPVLNAIRFGIRYYDHEEITRISMDQINHFITNICPIFSGNENNGTQESSVSGAVISFRDIADVRQMVYNLTEIEEATSFQHIVGNSPAAQSLREQGERISGSLSTVLITGESGTGKGLLARAIHASSPVKDGPYIVVNCGAIPGDLLESELFGYEEGAFTGARKSGKIGRFEMANNGTIFLDEIGDLPLHLQAKLLHVLQQREIQRVGGTEYIPVQIRVIAATNKDLEAMVRDRLFREDLFFRLNVIPIYVHPLRERREDIGMLLDLALQKYSKLIGKQITGFTREVRDILFRYDWPGNIRELENVVEYAVTMETGSLIGLESLPVNFRDGKDGPPPVRSLKEQCDEAEKKIILDCLRVTGFTLEGKRRAAELLRISESTLYRRIRHLGIRPDDSQ